MTSITVSIVAATVLALLSLAAMAWLAVVREAARLHSFNRFDGLHFED